MYIAFKKYKGQSHYILRESCTIDNKLGWRNLFDLGSDPSLFIKYSGGNAFYFNEDMENTISKLYRKLARELHPDTGGSHDKFVELNNAYQSLLSEI